MPGGDVGLAIIIFTFIVKLILFPLSAKSIDTQRKMRELEPELKNIQEKFKDNKEEQAKATMALYKEKKMNPFSGFFSVLLQIPIIIALYRVFLSGGLPMVDASQLYSFVKVPAMVSMSFLGILDVAKKSVVLALLAGVSQYFQAKYVLPKSTPKKSVDGKPLAFKDEFMRGMNLQMQYVLPGFIFIVAWSVSGAVALYWISNNTFAILQELYMRKKNGTVK